MAFNEKLNKYIEEIRRVKPFNYDSVFIENNEFKKQSTLIQVKFKALLLEEKDVDLWWDVIFDVVQENIGKVYRKYERNERLYNHKMFQMESCHHLIMNLQFCLDNQKLQMKKRIEGVLMLQDHQVQEHQRKNQEISEEGRIALKGGGGGETYASK